jgi:hypothetical protein
MSKENKSILFISDLHAPWMHPDTVPFLKALKKRYSPTRIILSGDEIDWHSISMHDHDPDLPSPSDELHEAIQVLKPIYKLFPKADVLESNHGSLVLRRALMSGLPKAVLKGYREILEAPKGWNWHFDLTIKLPTGFDCYLHHSKGANVKRNSQSMGMSFCQGHHHESFEIQYWGNPNALHFGLTAGCLVDPTSLALAYGKNNLRRPVIGCAVIVDGLPKLLPMLLNKRGRWTGYVP